MIPAILAQLADLATYLVAPQYEANPLMAAIPVPLVVIAKAAGVLAALLICRRLRRGYRLVAVAGLVGAGLNLAVLGGI